MSPFECSERIIFERQLFKFQMFQHRCERKISESGSNHKMTCRDLIQRNVHNLGIKRLYICFGNMVCPMMSLRLNRMKDLS